MLTNKKRLSILAAVFFILAAAVPLASARMDPLREVKAQIKTPNMLIILDTSGSMAWRTSDSTTVGGDTSTSRLYIAKEVIRNVVLDSYQMMNFGLMSYDQTHISLGDSTGYFPYYLVSTTCTTQTEFFSDRDLMDWGYFTLNAGPAATFTRRGTTYTLAASNNSLFHRGHGRHGHGGGTDTNHTYNKTADSCYQNHHTVYCTFSGYTWEYQGSYYTYSRCAASTTKKYTLNYLGSSFVDDGTITGTAGTYVYASFPNDYWSNGIGGSYPVDNDDNQGDLLVRISTDPAAQAAKANEILAWMALQNNGGLVARGNTPTGATLENKNTDPINEVLLSDSSGASPAIGDGTATPPSSVTYSSSTWTWEDSGGVGNSSYTCTSTCVIPPTAGGTGGPGTACASASDCLTCLPCSGTTKRCGGCNSSTDCESGFTCTGGYCQVATTSGTGVPGDACTTDANCLSCLKCINGSTGKKCGGCSSNNDCENGITCTSGVCGGGVVPPVPVCKSTCTIDTDCPQGQHCFNVTALGYKICGGCNVNSDCQTSATGFAITCDTTNHVCGKYGGTGTKVSGDACAGTSECACLKCDTSGMTDRCNRCDNNNVCQSGLTCNMGTGRCGSAQVVPTYGSCGATCVSTSNCRSGLACINGSAGWKCAGCTNYVDCGSTSGLVCNSGTCGLAAGTGGTGTCGATCASNSDCLNGIKCINSKCGGCSGSSDCQASISCTSSLCNNGSGSAGSTTTTTTTIRQDYAGKSSVTTGTCGQACNWDSDCLSGAHCNSHICSGTTGTGTLTNTCTFAGAYYTKGTSSATYNDAYSYFKYEVIARDALAKNGCRKNYVLLVTDGEPNGPSTGSTTCPSTYQDTDPEASYCAAYDLSHLAVGVGGSSTPVVTYVVGFGASTAGSTTLDTIAQQGGSPLKSDGHYAYYASDEAALEDSLRAIINEAARGDYTTAPPSYTYSAGGTGTVVFFSSAQYPEWNGHLRAVDAAKNQLIWDAGSVLSTRTAARNIYTSNPSTTPAYPIAFTTTNLTALRALGLGASDAEARAIIIFIHGKDRSWRLGDIVNSAPATLTPPPWRKLDAFGYQTFFDTYGYQLVSGRWVPKRNIVVFTGANDGMFHAFTMEAVTAGGTTIPAGDEVWAYIPPDLLPRLKDLYLNGGQISATDRHLYYVAASPKIEDICIDSSSPADGVCDSWLTELVCGEGPGGAHVFALDVTHPSPNDPNYDASKPFTVLWTTSNTTNTGLRTDVNKLGETFSNPAFGKVSYLSGSLTLTEDAIFMGSGYDDVNPGNVAHGGVGTTAYILRAQDGTAIQSFNAGDAPSGAITEFSLLANTVAYGFGSMFGWSTKSGTVDTWNLSDILQADLGGKLWTVVTSTDTNKSNWTMTTSYDAGSGQPFYYSPAMATIQVLGGTGTPVYINILAAISGAYADADMASTSFTPYVYLFQDVNGTITSFPGFPKTINSFQETVGGTSFPATTRPTGSPLIAIDDNGTPDDPSDDFIGVILTLFVPPDLSTAPCSYGEGYVTILKIAGLYNNGVNGATVTEAYSHKVSDSMPSPPFIVRGALVMTESGHGSNSASITTIGSVGVITSTNGNAKFLYWKEVR